MTIQYLGFNHGLLTRMDAAGNEYFCNTLLVISRLANIIILAVRRLNMSNTKAHDWTLSCASSIHLPSPQPTLADTLVAQLDGSTPLKPKSTIGHNPERAPSTSHFHNIISPGPSY